MNNETSKSVLWLIFITIFIDMLGLSILIPVFPLLIVHGSEFRVTPLNWTMAESYIMAGWLLAVYPLCQFFISPLLGQLSDRYGRRKILSYSILGTSVSYLIFAYGVFTKNIPLLFVSRALDGISGSNIATLQAIIGDISKEKNRAKNFGLIGVSIGAGFVFGPFLGGKLSDPTLYSGFNAATPFYFAFGLSLINWLLVFKWVPETLKQKQIIKIDFLKPLHNLSYIFKASNLQVIIPVLFLFNCGWTFFTTFWGVVLVTEFDFTQSTVGNFFAYLGFMIILAQGMVVRRLSGKVSDYKVLYFSLVLTGICLLVYYLAPSHHTSWIYIVPPFMAVAMALTKAFSNALITRINSGGNLGGAMGVSSSAQALAQVIPAILAGYIAASDARLTVLIASTLIFIAWLVFCLCFKWRMYYVYK